MDDPPQDRQRMHNSETAQEARMEGRGEPVEEGRATIPGRPGSPAIRQVAEGELTTSAMSFNATSDNLAGFFIFGARSANNTLDGNTAERNQ